MIEAARIQQVAEVVRRAGTNEQTLAALREAMTDIHFTFCLDDDVGPCAPIHAEDGFNLYLIDGRSQCLALTTDPASATGLLIAQVDDGA